MKLIALGDNCIDYYQNTEESFPGGNAINVSVHAAHQGVEAEYLGAFGEDGFAKSLKTSLRKNKVGFAHCPTIPGKTTKVCNYQVVNGERSFIGVLTGDTWVGPIQLDRREISYLKTADIIVSSCNAKMAEQIAAVEKLPSVFVYDFGEKDKYQTREYYDLVCHEMDLAMFSLSPISEKEFEDFCAPLHERGVVHVLATMGSEGQLISNGVKILKMYTHKVDAYDTMGAGDSFLAAFSCELMRLGWKKGKRMPEELLKRAIVLGQSISAQNCMNQGGFGTKIQS